MDRLKIILFGMTGFGNSALDVIVRDPMLDCRALFTPIRERYPFPYYDCEFLQDKGFKQGIPVHEGLKLRAPETAGLIRSIEPDLIIVSSFRQIVPDEIIAIPPRGIINVHPSLLPKYRGGTPTYWVLLNSEEETGVTVHYIDDEKIDSGRIITQDILHIDEKDTDGILRRRLAELSKKTLKDALEMIKRGTVQVSLADESTASSYPKRTPEDALVDLDRPFEEIKRKIRALTPYPGACIVNNGREYIVTNVERIDNIKDNLSDNGTDYIQVRTRDGLMRFEIKKEK